jgi:hypothetical protein
LYPIFGPSIDLSRQLILNDFVAICIVAQSFALSAEYIPPLESIFKAAHLATTYPQVATEIAKAEEMFGISVPAIQKMGLTPLQSAKEVLKQGQLAGRLPLTKNPRRFEYPVIDHSTDNLLAEPMAAPRVTPVAAPQPAASNSAISAATLAFSSDPEPEMKPMLSPEQQRVELEKRKKEQEAKKAKALEEKENEVQQRKTIREQFEKDRAERLRQEEERRTKRAAEMQLATQNGGLNGSSGSLAVPVAQSAATQSSSNGSSPNPSPRRPSPAPTAAAAEPAVQRSGHWATPAASSRPTAERPIFVPPEEIIAYTQVLRRLESEKPKATQMIKTLEALRLAGAAPQLDEALAQWKRYAESIDKDIATVTAILRGESPETAKFVAPAEPVGFTLRDPSTNNMDVEEVDIEPKVLTMIEGTPLWRVKVHLLQGPPVVVTIHPSHTIQDLYQHLASLSPFTNRYRLEIVGKPGELEMTDTAEASGLKMTTLRLILK